MAAANQNLRRYGNHCLQTPEDEADLHEGFADGVMKVGQVVIAGANDEDYADAGADAANALGAVIGFWDADGVYSDLPAAAIADNQRVRVALFTQGFAWLGLLPDTVAVLRGDQLRTAALGRLTTQPATDTLAAARATVARAYEDVTATADDDTVLVSTGGMA